MINIGTLLSVMFLFCVNIHMYARASEESFWKLVQQPLLYVLIFETLVFVSSFVGSCIFMGIISRANLARMFNSVGSEIEEWVNGKQKSEDVLKVSSRRTTSQLIYNIYGHQR